MEPNGLWLAGVANPIRVSDRGLANFMRGIIKVGGKVLKCLPQEGEFAQGQQPVQFEIEVDAEKRGEFERLTGLRLEPMR